MRPAAGMQKLRAASCSVLLLLLTLALVASSLLVARYAVQASSWWLSLLAITVCLLGLCTWIQLGASRAATSTDRWRVMLLARQIALSRGRVPAPPGPGHLAGVAHISDVHLDSDYEGQVYRVPGPPPPPPYAVADLPSLPPSYCAASPAVPHGQELPAPPAPPPPPPPGPEQPPPYDVAIRRDHLVHGTPSVSDNPHGSRGRRTSEGSHNNSNNNNNSTHPRSSSVAGRRPILWY